MNKQILEEVIEKIEGLIKIIPSFNRISLIKAHLEDELNELKAILSDERLSKAVDVSQIQRYTNLFGLSPHRNGEWCKFEDVQNILSTVAPVEDKWISVSDIRNKINPLLTLVEMAEYNKKPNPEHLHRCRENIKILCKIDCNKPPTPHNPSKEGE